MKVIMVTSNMAHQVALANKLNAEHPLAAIVIEKKTGGKKRDNLITRMIDRLLTFPIANAWRHMLSHYRNQFSAFPDAPLQEARNVNAAEVIELISVQKPDLVLVSGTSLLRQPLIEAIENSGAIMNLHTGISPYVNGGPNCTNWCLATGRYDLIGSTIMWLDAGIDSGNIISTGQVPLDGNETLSDLHLKVMEHAHSLYVDAYRQFIRGGELPNIDQTKLGSGETYYSKDWTTPKKLRMLFNFYARYNPQSVGCARKTHACHLVSLPQP